MRFILSVKIQNFNKKVQFNIDKSMILGIVFENKNEKDKFIMSMVGKEKTNGDIVINDISLKSDTLGYKRYVDLICVDDRLNSSLSVIDYILFFCMISGNYNSNTIMEIDKILKQLELLKTKKVSMNNLPKEMQIEIRCIAAHLKDVKLLICDDIMKYIDSEGRERLYLMLNNYFVENECICIIISDDKETIEKFVNHIIFI